MGVLDIDELHQNFMFVDVTLFRMHFGTMYRERTLADRAVRIPLIRITLPACDRWLKL